MGIGNCRKRDGERERESKVASAYVFPYIHTNTHTLDEINLWCMLGMLYAVYFCCCCSFLFFPFFEGEDS